MITSITRPYTVEEKRYLIANLPSLGKKIELLVITFIYIHLSWLIPFLLIRNFFSISADVEKTIVIFMSVIVFVIAYFVTSKFEGGFSNRKNIENINKGFAEVVHVKTTRAIKREDAEDSGLAFYVEIIENEQVKILFLWGQYLDELDEKKFFPNTEFEYVKMENSDEFIDFRVLGQYFQPERTLPPFDDEFYKDKPYPENFQIIDQKLDEIK